MGYPSNRAGLRAWQEQLETIQTKHGVARSIEQCLRYLEEEAQESGLLFLSQVIGLAVLAAQDDAQNMEFPVPPGPPH